VSAVYTAFQFDFLCGRPLRHGLSGRVPHAPEEGNAGHIREASEADVTANRRAFMAELGLVPAHLTLARQTHSARVAVATEADRGRGRPPAFDGFPETDAIVTNVADIAIGVTVADCVPLLLYDPVQHALGIAHAGWRGTVSGIAMRTVEQMATAFGSRPSDLQAGIGASLVQFWYDVV
jgi:YfiH family protein